MNKQIINTLHDLGKTPDKYFYQINGKTAQENYIDQKNAIKDQIIQQTEAPEEEYEIVSQIKVNGKIVQ